MRRFAPMIALALCGCPEQQPEHKQVSAGEACLALEARGVGTNCQQVSTGALGAAAQEAFDITLAHGKKGQVLRFRTDGEFDAAVEAFEAASVLAGKHRYGNRKQRIFVQLNADTPQHIGVRAYAVVRDL